MSEEILQDEVQHLILDENEKEVRMANTTTLPIFGSLVECEDQEQGAVR